jgi:O-antigen ligase
MKPATQVVGSDGHGASERSLAITLAIILAAGTFVLPLVFTIALDDVFALPKTAVMLGLSIVLLGGLLLLARRPGTIALGQVSGVTLALGAYLVLTSAATLRSPDPLHSLLGEQLQYQGLLATVGYALAFLAARSSLGNPGWLRRLIAVAVGAAVAVSLYGLLQQLDADPLWDILNKGRPFSTLGQANALAAYLVLVLPLALALSINGRGIGRAAGTLAAAAIWITLALTLSRGGYLGGGLALLVFAVCVVRRLSLTRRRVAIGGGLVVGVLALVAVVPPVSRMAERVVDRVLQTADLGESSAASHLDLWAVGVRMAVDYPLLGIGPEIYPQLFPRYRDDVLSPARAAVMGRFRPESPHNVPIAIAVGAGIPALVAYLAILGLAMRAGWLRLRRAPPMERLLLAALLAGVAGHFTTDLFMTAEVTGSWMSWVMLGALCAGADGASTHRVLPRSQDVPPRAGASAGGG